MLAILFRNWHLKIIAAICAVILWLFVVGQHKVEMGLSVPLELQNIPAGLMVANDLPGRVQLRVSGPRTLLSTFLDNKSTIVLNLEHASAGVNTFTQMASRLDLPRALKVLRVSPAKVEVRLEPIKQKRVPVSVTTAGETPRAYALELARPSPSKVLVEGAANHLQGLNAVATEPVDISNITSSQRQEVGLVLKNSYLWFPERDWVSVWIVVKPLPPPAVPLPPEKSRSQK